MNRKYVFDEKKFLLPTYFSHQIFLRYLFDQLAAVSLRRLPENRFLAAFKAKLTQKSIVTYIQGLISAQIINKYLIQKVSK